MENPELKLGDILAQQRTDLAIERTILASVNSIQAWIRTSLSMIGFGFTIYKFLQSLQNDGLSLMRPQTPRNVGLILIGLGTLSIVFGMLDYWLTHRGLQKKYGFRIKIYPIVLALLIVILGLLLFITIILE